MLRQYAVKYRYSTIIFPTNTHNSYPMARPLGGAWGVVHKLDRWPSCLMHNLLSYRTWVLCRPVLARPKRIAEGIPFRWIHLGTSLQGLWYLPTHNVRAVVVLVITTPYPSIHIKIHCHYHPRAMYVSTLSVLYSEDYEPWGQYRKTRAMYGTNSELTEGIHGLSFGTEPSSRLFFFHICNSMVWEGFGN